MNKILSIQEKKPVSTFLPDGNYFGTHGGRIIEIRYKDRDYELTTEEGLRGVGFKVVVKIQDQVGTYEYINN